MWYRNHLMLVANCDKHYDHIIELELLINMLETSKPHYGVSEEQWRRLVMLAHNTYRAHYEDGIVETVHTELQNYKPVY